MSSTRLYPSIMADPPKTDSAVFKRRMAAEQFVRDRFKAHYRADVEHFMPTLLSLSDARDQLQAVLGFRRAGESSLFLEHYLDQPVEQVLASRLQAPVDRGRLVEVGNLAVSASGGGRWLIAALTAYLSAIQAEWALFTIGSTMLNAFHRLGLEPIELAEARRHRLPVCEQNSWGSYYTQKPRVMAGNVAHGYAVLSALCEKESALSALWQEALAIGRQAA